MSTPATQPVLPRDARLIALLLAANGAQDCEEGVVRMLVEFAHRYTTDILTDSLVYAEHARSGTGNTTSLVPSLDDVRLAVQARTDGASVPKEFLLQLASQVNAVPLPNVPEVYGVRLPPQSARLTAPNFSLAPRSSAPPLPTNVDNLTMGNDAMTGIVGTGVVGSSGLGAGVSLDGTPGGATDEDDDENGLFGEDGDDSDEDDDEDEEMEDSMATGGVKRKAESDEDDYDS
ncbi:TFIID-31kDa-domain-containing protein [Meredithblackwellia eburnea MCA 4105]